MNVYLEQLGHLAPEMALIALSLIVLVADLLTKGRDSRRMGYVTLAGLGAIMSYYNNLSQLSGYRNERFDPGGKHTIIIGHKY